MIDQAAVLLQPIDDKLIGILDLQPDEVVDGSREATAGIDGADNIEIITRDYTSRKAHPVEYSFPPLVPGDDDPTACPAGWKYLPTLALPDGSHNYDEDAVYFHLPSLTNPKETVFGISCYRQIPVEKLKVRACDVTRSTVQKSVCVLSALPLYGHIQVKMALITHAYFDEGDFSQVKLLHDTYHHLNSCLQHLGPLAAAPQLFVGLSPRDLILQFGHKAIMLFKLILLERRLVFYRSPVQPLCAVILTLLSLHPGMIEVGLTQSACIRPSRPMSPLPDFSEQEMLLENTCNTLKEIGTTQPQIIGNESGSPESNNVVKGCDDDAQAVLNAEKGTREKQDGDSDSVKRDQSGDADGQCDSDDRHRRNQSGVAEGQSGSMEGQEEGQSEITDSWIEVSTKLPMSESLGNFPAGGGTDVNMAGIAQMDATQCGLPLSLFTQGNLCLPYLSLPYMDLLSDVNVRGYIVGATNVLFKQKRNLADVLVEVDGARVETQDLDLRRQLHLTTEDLRFADHIVRRVAGERHDVFLDGVGWEGGDEWLRSQFKAYALCLLRTSLLQDGSREADHFNASYMAAWKATHNYKRWVSGDHSGIWELNPGHPFAGQLSVADMKLRLSHTMQNTEGGRKLNQAMTSTGRAVATTGRAVGGAITQAKGALSNWWSTLTTVQNAFEENDDSRQNDDCSEELPPPQSYQTVPDVNPNLVSDISPQACQLDNHKLDFETQLSSVQNIECSSSSIVNEVEGSLSSRELTKENSLTNKENTYESLTRAVEVPKPDLNSSGNSNKLKHMKSPRIEII